MEGIMKRLLRYVIPFSGLLLAFIFIRTISVGAYAENIQEAQNKGWTSQAAVSPSPSTPEGAILVTTLDDELNSDGDCSLREAIQAANTNTYVDACGTGVVLTDTITFDVAGTISVTSQLSVTSDGPLVIIGAEAITITGGLDAGRIFSIGSSADLNLESLNIVDSYGTGIYIENGNVVVSDCIISGNSNGGIFNSLGALTIVDSTLSSNSTNSDGGGIYNFGTIEISNSSLISNSVYSFGDLYSQGGGIFNFGTLTIINSTLVGNSVGSGGTGGGISNYGTLEINNSSLINNNGHRAGGGIYNNWRGTVIITNVILSNNSGGTGGGISNVGGILEISNSSLISNNSYYGGGGISNSGVMTITKTMVSKNNGYNYGGGIFNDDGTLTITDSTLVGNSVGNRGRGGGIYNSGNFVSVQSTLTITNSTISSNHAEVGGGIYNNSLYPATLINITLSGNEANLGGGIYIDSGTSNSGPSKLIATNTIVANSPSGGDCEGTIIDGGHNLSSDFTCGFDLANDSLPNTDPVLGPLQDNGGSTWTHELIGSSPAIDAGDNALCPPTDQRGMVRPFDGNVDGLAVCDIGAYEFEGGLSLSPYQQFRLGRPADILEYPVHLYNLTHFTDTFSIDLGSHAWVTSLSTDLIGPLPPGSSQTFTTTVTIPLDASWFLTDTVIITAASVTSPTVFWDTASLTTQAYATAEISMSPLELSSSQYPDEQVTQTLTISNGFGVTLTYNISEEFLPDGSLLLLHLDDPVGSTTFVDASGNEHHGSCSGYSCPNAGIPGKLGTALGFDKVDDAITLGNWFNLQSFSISMWIRPSSTQVELANLIDNNYNVYRSWRIQQMGADYPPNSYLFEYNSPDAIQFSLKPYVWQFLVITQDETGYVSKVYVDGNLVDTATGNHPIPYDGSEFLQMGGRVAGGRNWGGLIDEVMIYERPLTSQEVQALYQLGSEGAVHWLDINPISGNVPTISSKSVSVTFDSTGLLPAVNKLSLFIHSNDPLIPSIQVPVSMTVMPVATNYPIYLPLVTKSSAVPISSMPAFYMVDEGVVIGLVIMGIVGRWKRRE
jgi:CSLREA domain-containing protein